MRREKRKDKGEREREREREKLMYVCRYGVLGTFPCSFSAATEDSYQYVARR